MGIHELFHRRITGVYRYSLNVPVISGQGFLHNDFVQHPAHGAEWSKNPMAWMMTWEFLLSSRIRELRHKVCQECDGEPCKREEHRKAQQNFRRILQELEGCLEVLYGRDEDP